MVMYHTEKCCVLKMIDNLEENDCPHPQMANLLSLLEILNIDSNKTNTLCIEKILVSICYTRKIKIVGCN